MQTFDLSVDLSKIFDHFECSPQKLESVTFRPLPGWGSNSEVFKIDISHIGPDGRPGHLACVKKYTHYREYKTMQLLSRLDSPDVPRLIDSGKNPGKGPEYWFLYPFYETDPETSEHPTLPDGIIRCLAQIHTHYQQNQTELQDMEHYNMDAFRGHMAWLLDHFNQKKPLGRLPFLDQALADLETLQDSPHIKAALDQLPVTLIHGDVHPGNLLAHRGRHLLIDWGNAKAGPAMLDVANRIEWASPEYQAYIRHCMDFDPEYSTAHDELGFLMGQVYINTNYLPWVMRDYPNDPEGLPHAEGMINIATKAREKIQVLLG